MPGFEQELKVGLQSVQLASRICRAVQSTITPEKLDKKDKSPVTIADFASQAAICRALAQAFPQDVVVGEEDSAELRTTENAGFLKQVVAELHKVDVSGTADEVCGWIDRGAGQGASRFWTLDPIDGTKGFLRGEQYAISLALIINGQIEVAVLGCPNLPMEPASESTSNGNGSLFFAVRSSGAFVLPIDDAALNPAKATRISVSRTTDWKDACVCESVESGHSSHSRSEQIAQSLGIVRPPVRLDSQAKYAVVARGEADLYLRLPTKQDYFEKIWDHAGGVLVVEEAGGQVTDVAGRPLEFTHGRELRANRGVVVSNGRMHNALIEAVKAAGVS